MANTCGGGGLGRWLRPILKILFSRFGIWKTIFSKFALPPRPQPKKMCTKQRLANFPFLLPSACCDNLYKTAVERSTKESVASDRVNTPINSSETPTIKSGKHRDDRVPNNRWQKKSLPSTGCETHCKTAANRPTKKDCKSVGLQP